MTRELRFTLVGLVSGVVLAGLLAVLLGGEEYRNDEAVIKLVPGPGGTGCRVSSKTEHFVVGRGVARARWTVINTCRDQAIVTFSNFRRRRLGVCLAQNRPVEGEGGEVPGGETFTIELERNEAGRRGGEWCYEVRVNGQKSDPGLRFDPY